MISKREILDSGTYTRLQPHVVEKDYVLGWLLAGIYQHPELRQAWVFKGGTCLKKCYFETYRFSEDLDFTLNNTTHINEAFLPRRPSQKVADWVYGKSGIEIPVDRITFEIFNNPRGVASCQGRIYYRGPVTPAGKQAGARIKLDLTTDEVLDEPVLTPVRHDYGDQPEEGITIQELFVCRGVCRKNPGLKRAGTATRFIRCNQFFPQTRITQSCRTSPGCAY
nr:nucleotidyl transferase AbiEii/AbiGii toxin family protein [Haliscomenobacter sp.]